MTEILLESPPAVLSTTEQAARDRCETVIARGMAQFLAVGEALSEMRDSKLYRSTHATFADYCRERWDLGRARAYQLMDAAEVAGSLSTNVDIPPATEAQLRALKAGLLATAVLALISLMSTKYLPSTVTTVPDDESEPAPATSA